MSKIASIKDKYERFCSSYGVPFEDIQSIKAPDDTTLFCSAGMQRFKKEFLSGEANTIATNQRCLRVEDLNSLGDGTHFAEFNMLGLFSFRDWSVENAISFWLSFLKSVGITALDAHIHPDKAEWKQFYPPSVTVVLDSECRWTDGEIGGYCTEFYVNGVEIGNIVNPLGNCIDAGFGSERIDVLVNGTFPKTKKELQISACLAIIGAGYKPSNKKQGYVLRRLLRELVNEDIDIPFLKEERERQNKIRKRYETLKRKFPDQTKEWWFQTHGILIDEMV